MGLSEIAAGIEVTARQEERGVAAVDDTGDGLVERLAPHAAALPCTAAAAAVVLETHARGVTVGDSAREAGIAPMTAAKALHRCGVSGVSPLGPTGRRVVRDWLAGDLSRADALELAGGDEAAFALAGYVEAHEPIPELTDAARGGDGRGGNASVEKRDALGETMSSVSDLR
ncbi:hypothetical protein Hbl1158_02165 [Halobaculum sp. CBA1158]|uniref:DUF7858 family protein n=1 Tax=Halobaculum sp. CBA1158 TaxID=2904243 RepID=UPI001F32BB6E|nr:hypothetical protein [Halobaculum sp. CBA1158]UIP00197.1 hypothetical protein Hbl1158_02165 [Halobaculum sp. CBA1158]